jgi:raffinose/stachyose/melibiose transport system substrate-binding protein
MKAKKVLALILALVLVLALAACGGTSTNTNTNTNANAGGKSIRLVNGKIEVDAMLKKLAAMYEEKTGVKVEIESMGGGIDIQGTLKGYYQAKNMPDIFVNGGAADFSNWNGLLADMSGEAWVSDTDAAYVDDSGAVIGFPYTVEAIGLAYNTNILEKAGIDASTLTSPAAYEAAFAKLDGMKDELGLTAVVGYYTEPVNLYWSSGNHVFGQYEDAGLAREDTTYFDLLADGGKLDTARFTDFAKFIGLLQNYADQSMMISGTYDQQVLNFASGKYAFVTQGNWIGATMTSDDKEAYEAAGSFQAGFAPYAFQDGIDTILTNSPSWWAIYKDGNVEEAKAFLQWLTSDEAQDVLVHEAGFISPFKSCKYVATDPFAQSVSDYIAAGKTSNWHWQANKEGLAQNYLGQVFNDYAQGKLDLEKFVETCQQVCQACYAG